MRKVLLSVALVLFFAAKLFSQDKMIVKESAGSTYYDDFSRDITSLNRLPHRIVSNVKGIINKSLGELSPNVQFYKGQIVNVRKYFARDTDAYDYGWILTKYDLNFVIRDSLLGIERYVLNIRADKYGQIVEINWPRNGYNSRSAFVSRDSIKAFVLKKAAKLGFNQANYKIEFMYDKRNGRFLWQFLFPKYRETSYTRWFDCIQINWADINDFKVYETSKTILY